LIAAALVALLTLSAPDAGVDEVIDAAHATLMLPDGGVTQRIGGVWLSDDAAIARATQMQALADANKQLLKPAPQQAPSSLLPLTLGLTGGLVVGLILGLTLTR
jgi:hypothetical protein